MAAMVATESMRSDRTTNTRGTAATARTDTFSNAPCVTMMDFFITGFNGQDAHYYKNFWIPDPPATISKPPSAATSVALNDGGWADGSRPAEKLLSGFPMQSPIVRSYWRSYAGWPAAWQGLGAAHERSKDFQDQFSQQADVVCREGSANFAQGIKASMVFAVMDSTPVWATRPSDQIGMSLASHPEQVDELIPGTCFFADLSINRPKSHVLRIPQGWVQMDRGDSPNMAHVTEPECGLWWYRVACKEIVEIRMVPACRRRSSRTGWMLSPGEVVTISFRGIVHGQRYLQLADGRGWVFERRGALQHEVDLADELVMQELSIRAPSPSASSADLDNPAVQKGLWCYEVLDRPVCAMGSDLHGVMLEPRERFYVDMRVPASGKAAKEVSSKAVPKIQDRIWLRLQDGRGWLPKADAAGFRPTVKFIGIATDVHSESRRSLVSMENELRGVV